METVITVNIFVFLIVCFISTLVGLNPKKWSSWLLGLYGFLTGILSSFIREDADVSSRLILGAILAFAVMAGGAKTYWNKQIYTKEYVQSLRDKLDRLHRLAEKKRERKRQKKQGMRND